MATVSYATGGNGTLTKYIGWVDFTGITANANTSINYQCLIPNVGFINMIINNPTTIVWGPTTGAGWPFATAYTGVAGNPGMITKSAGLATLNFNDINLTDLSGRPLDKAYNIIVSDAEGTWQTEFIRWTTNGQAWINTGTVPNTGVPWSLISGVGTQTIQNNGRTGGNTFITPVPFTQNPTRVQINANGVSNEASAFGVIVNLIVSNKTVDKGNAIVGDILTYTIPISNSSLDTLNSVNFVDTLPSNAIYVPNSFTLNGSNYPAATFPSTATLPDLASNATYTVSYKVQITGLNPSPIRNSSYIFGNQGSIPNSTNTNFAVTTIPYASLNSTKTVNYQTAGIGYTLNYSIALQNTGTLTANNILFIDTIPSGTSFITSTLKQDTTTISGSPNPPGVTLPNSIAPGKVSTVTFSVLVATIPTINPIPNNSSAAYNYSLNGVTASSSTTSNTVSTQINYANLGNISKSVDKSFATCGDILKYTISIPNGGNVTAQNVLFKDTIPNGTTLVSDSVFVNGTPQPTGNPNTGVTIPNIAPGEAAVITFSVKVSC